MKWNHIKNILPFFGLILFFYIIYDTGINEIFEIFKKISFQAILISSLLFIPRFFISTYKWMMICKKQGIDARYLYLIKINLIGLFYGSITPLWLGDYIRAPYLREESKKPISACVINVFIDQIIELASLIFLALFGSIFIYKRFPYLFPSFLFISLIFILLYFIFEKNSKKILSFFKFVIPERFSSWISLDYVYNFPSLIFLSLTILIEILSYLILFLQIYIISLSMNISIPFLDFVIIYSVASLIGIIPVTIAGFGTRESTLIYLFSFYGIDSASVVALSLSGYVITILLPAFIGGILSIKR
ncbi:MAG: flippase-like domain-containing protein [Thermoplasmatales archaeon]|nr:flippase-like domain-containing protein [Thermoplasmatales archaeon]